MIVLDASVLIAHLSSQDVHHEASTRLLLDAGEQPLLVHSLTLAEVLAGGARVGRGAQMLTDLLAIGVTLADRDDGEPLRLAELRASTRLKLPDCCVIDTAQVNAAALASYDDALIATARGLGVTVAT